MYLWFARGSAGFINLGVHTSPPPPELELAVDSRPVPETVDWFTDRPAERLLAVAWELRKRLGDWRPISWP